ncbi:MAG: low molecular weight protein arginine phosphatase [Defluviitaleaceae bacterium]|nr:low molecular weight protein arginine phosphatase [Defluviitaleaceae bacterium]
MSEIIFVCTGNTCRSPMAAALAAAIFEREGLEFAVSSAGVFASGGTGASKNAVLAMELEKIDLREHKSRAAAAEILQDAALVLTMTRTHLSHVKSACPAANAFTLGEFAGGFVDVADPFGGNLDEYKFCAAQIKKLLEQCVEKFHTIKKER